MDELLSKQQDYLHRTISYTANITLKQQKRISKLFPKIWKSMRNLLICKKKKKSNQCALLFPNCNTKI